MKKLMEFCAMMVLLLVFAVGCGTTYKLYTLDKEGKAILIEDVDTDIIGSVVQSTKNKTVIVWHTGWAFGFSVSPGTVEDPTPTAKLICGKFNDGYMGIIKEHDKDFDWSGLAQVIQSTNNKLSVSTSGASETGPVIEPAKVPADSNTK